MLSETAIVGVFGAVAVPLLTGITIIAYRHPKAYPKLYPWLLGFGLILFLVFGVWDSAMSVAQISALTTGRAKNLDGFEISSAIATYNVPSIWWFLPAGIMGYSSFLSWLPYWLFEEKP